MVLQPWKKSRARRNSTLKKEKPMAHFQYKAVDKAGHEQDGSIFAASYQDAFAKIKDRGLYPTEIYQATEKELRAINVPFKKKSLLRFFMPPLKTKQLVPFVSDLAVLLDSGISLVRALSVLQNQTLSKRLKYIINEISADVEGGASLSDALSKHPHSFSHLFVNMVRAGELGGILGQALNRLAVLYEKNSRLESKLKAALTYPMVVLCFALAVVVFIVAFIVPKFFEIFGDMGAELPQLTVMLYNVSMFVRAQWLPIGVSIVVIIVSLKIALRFRPFRFVFDGLMLRLPVFGILFSKVSIARFCRTFGTLLASGVPILQTLSVAKDATGNLVFEQAIERVKDSVKEGESVAGPLSQYAMFPPLVINMITVGEETGALNHMLIKIADRYDEDVDTMVSQLSSLVEPFLIVGLGIIVGFIVISLFLPLVSIVQNLTAI